MTARVYDIFFRPYGPYTFCTGPCLNVEDRVGRRWMSENQRETQTCLISASSETDDGIIPKNVVSMCWMYQ